MMIIVDSDNLRDLAEQVNTLLQKLIFTFYIVFYRRLL